MPLLKRRMVCVFCEAEFSRVVWFEKHTCVKSRAFTKKVKHLLVPIGNSENLTQLPKN